MNTCLASGSGASSFSQESSQSAGNFNRGESSLKQQTVQTKKTRNKRKIETMISNMNIKIVRYQASIDQPQPKYFTPDFLDEFRMLPGSFYTPDAPEKFELFIQRWGTHLVKSVKLGGKFKMTRTVKNDGSVLIDDFQRETQNEFERVTGAVYADKAQNKAVEKIEAQIAAAAGSADGGATGTCYQFPSNLYFFSFTDIHYYVRVIFANILKAPSQREVHLLESKRRQIPVERNRIQLNKIPTLKLLMQLLLTKLGSLNQRLRNFEKSKVRKICLT